MRERETEFPSRREAGGELLLPLSRFSLSSSLPLSQRNFRREERREENFSSLSPVSLSPPRSLSRNGISVARRGGRRTSSSPYLSRSRAHARAISLATEIISVARGVLRHPLLPAFCSPPIPRFHSLSFSPPFSPVFFLSASSPFFYRSRARIRARSLSRRKLFPSREECSLFLLLILSSLLPHSLSSSLPLSLSFSLPLF